MFCKRNTFAIITTLSYLLAISSFRITKDDDGNPSKAKDSQSEVSAKVETGDGKLSKFPELRNKREVAPHSVDGNNDEDYEGSGLRVITDSTPDTPESPELEEDESAECWGSGLRPIKTTTVDPDEDESEEYWGSGLRPIKPSRPEEDESVEFWGSGLRPIKTTSQKPKSAAPAENLDEDWDLKNATAKELEKPKENHTVGGKKDWMGWGMDVFNKKSGIKARRGKKLPPLYKIVVRRYDE